MMTISNRHKPNPKSISFLFPAYNEQQTLPTVINKIPKKELEDSEFLLEILIVNPNTKDKIEAVALETRKLGFPHN